MSTETKPYDLLIRNVRVVRPNAPSVESADIAIKDGKFAAIGRDLPVAGAAKVTDGRAASRFPGWWTPTCTQAFTPLSRKTR
jgi:allantoinase